MREAEKVAKQLQAQRGPSVAVLAGGAGPDGRRRDRPRVGADRNHARADDLLRHVSGVHVTLRG
jgi:hypothetical protein